MSDNGKTGVIMVLTSDTQDKILLDSGVFVARVNADKVMQSCQYVVCVQNNPQNDADETLFGHKEAFLVGTIVGVSPSNANGDRLIKFDTYATFHKRNAWINGPTRTGIAYFATPTDAKLRMGSYTFQPVQPTGRKTTAYVNPNPMSNADFAELSGLEMVDDKPMVVTPMKNTGFDLTEAKAVIAKALGVSVDQVEITVKA